MKGLQWILILLALALDSEAQYYYRDIVITKQTMQKWNAFRENKVKKVILASFERNGEPTPGFDCNQVVSEDYLVIYTYTQTNLSNPTSLIAYYDNKGFLRKTVDTSDTYQSTTEYDYDGAGRVISIRNNALQTDNQVKNTETHEWKYGPDGRPLNMLKIANGTDTTTVQFVLDGKGNVIEEHPASHRISLPIIYYYYDSANTLTDVVRFNEKANRLLPDYIFERNGRGQLKTMLFLPPGTNEYQKWIYEYQENGLEKKESCFNRKNQLMGKIEYQYDFRKS